MTRIPRMVITGEQAVYHVMSRTALEYTFGTLLPSDLILTAHTSIHHCKAFPS